MTVPYAYAKPTGPRNRNAPHLLIHTNGTVRPAITGDLEHARATAAAAGIPFREFDVPDDDQYENLADWARII